MLAEIALASLLPGWPSFQRRRVLSVFLLAIGVASPFGLLGYAVSGHRAWVALTVDTGFLAWTLVVLALSLVARLVAVSEVWWEHRGEPIVGRDRWSVPVALAVCVPLGVGIVQTAEARDDIAPVFTPTDDASPLFDPNQVPATTSGEEATTATTDTTGPATTAVAPGGGTLPGADPLPTATTLPPKPERPLSGVDPDVVAGVHNVLLIGGDAGPDRGGLRTDTMMLFSLHTRSGRAALISIPRDLDGLLFPPGSELERRYPYGWDDLANAIYPIVSSDQSLREAYTVDGVRPGVVALAHAIGYSLDVTIDDYVLVDMQGFLEFVDALGGVTVNVPVEVPMPGNVPGAPTEYPDTIGPGVIDMDGTTVLGYVRSRKGDSDFQRTRRQREVLAALATQIDARSVVANFPRIAETISGTLRTSLTPDELAETLAVIGGVTAIVESVGLVPPLVDVYDPDYQRLAEIVGAVRVAIATGVPSGY